MEASELKTLVLITAAGTFYKDLEKGVGPSTVARWMRSKARLEVATYKTGREDTHVMCEHVVAFRITD